MPKIKMYVSTNVSGSRIEDECDLPDDWDSMSDAERSEYLNDCAAQHLSNHAEYGAYVED